MPPHGPRLRLATFSYGLPVAGLKRGGIERSAHMLADGLARRGHNVVVFTHDPKPAEAAYDVRPLPWKTFVDTWIGRRMTMGYLGNVLAVAPDYREFDAIIAHGDSLLLPITGKPVIRVLHGSALGEARSARSTRTRSAAARCVRAGAADRDAPEGRGGRQRERPPSESVRAPRDLPRRGRSGVRSRAAGAQRPALAAVRRHAGRPQARALPAPSLRRRRATDASGCDAHHRRRRGAAVSRRHLSHGNSPTSSSPRSIGVRGSTSRRAPTRASAFRISKRWPAARRSSPRRIPEASSCSTTVPTACWPTDEEFGRRISALLSDAPARAAVR